MREAALAEPMLIALLAARNSSGRVGTATAPWVWCWNR